VRTAVLDSLGIIHTVLDETTAAGTTDTASRRCGIWGWCKAERVVWQILIDSEVLDRDCVRTPADVIVRGWSMPDASLLSHYHPVLGMNPEEDRRSMHNE